MASKLMKMVFVARMIRQKLCMIYAFWTPGLPVGVHSNRPCPSVHPSVRLSVFKYLRDCSLVFSNFLHEVRAPFKGTKVTEPDF